MPDVTKDCIDLVLDDPLKKAKAITELEILGFPLEFKIRKILVSRGYRNVGLGFYKINIDDVEILKSYDISAYKEKLQSNNIGIQLHLKIIGECKYSKEKNKCIFLILEISNLRNLVFMGPILSSLKKCQTISFDNSVNAQIFKDTFGDINFYTNAEEINIHSKDGKIDKKDTPNDTKINNIAENTIMPACTADYHFWRMNFYLTYKHEVGRAVIPGHRLSFWANLIVPIIITSKPLLIPIINDENIITDIKKMDYALYFMRHRLSFDFY